MSQNDNFWDKVLKAGPDDCWLWQGPVTPTGYGRSSVYIDGMRIAHRIAWVLTYGEIPDGLHVLHCCDNPPCCNPAHLWLGTHLENIADKVAKDRQSKGSNNGGAKLCEDDIRAIRMDPRSRVAVAKEYGVSPQKISEIVLLQAWRHVI